MKQQTTYCRICEAACGLIAETKGQEVVRLRPDPDHVVSKGFVCAKGIRFSAMHDHPDRLNHPLERHEGQLRRTTWDTALGDIGAKLRSIIDTHGRDAVGVYLGNPTAFDFSTPFAGLGFTKALGTRNGFNAGSLDCSNKFAVSAKVFGTAATHPVPDLDHAEVALLLGTNPSISASSFVNAPRWIERLRAIEARGGKVYVVDPRRTETARSVGEHVPIVPDTDGLLLMSLLHVVFDEGLENRGRIERYANGIPALRAAAKRFPPEKVAERTGIPAEKIREIARRFAKSKGSFGHLSTGVNQGTFGTIAYAAKVALEMVTGHLDRKGGALLPLGAVDLAGLARKSSFDRDTKIRSRIGGFKHVAGALPTGILADEILTPGRDQIRALFVVAGNPLLSAPDGDRLAQAFEKLDLLVVLDLFVNDTAAYATHVLPCTDWLEREDMPYVQFQLQPVPYVQWTDPVVQPKYERRHDWQVMFDIAQAADLPLFGSRAMDKVVRTAFDLGGPGAMMLPHLIPSVGLRPLKKLRKNPHGFLVQRERPGSYLEERIGTDSGRLELFDGTVWSRLDGLESTLTPPAENSLRLITRRQRLGHNSWLHANENLTTAEQRAYLCPTDARRLGISTGDPVRITSAASAVELPAEITDEVVPGSIAVTHGYGHHPKSGWNSAKDRGGTNVNRLASSGPDALDPVSGMCQFIGIPVRVERIAASATAAAE